MEERSVSANVHPAPFWAQILSQIIKGEELFTSAAKFGGKFKNVTLI